MARNQGKGDDDDDKFLPRSGVVYRGLEEGTLEEGALEEGALEKGALEEG